MMGQDPSYGCLPPLNEPTRLCVHHTVSRTDEKRDLLRRIDARTKAADRTGVISRY